MFTELIEDLGKTRVAAMVRASSKKTRKSSALGAEAAAASLGKRRSESDGDGALLADDVLTEIEQRHPEGMSLSQIIETFVRQGLHLSEATFRKYVQLGLLGRSRRVGRKGKHQGSLGVYPATTVRRINVIKQMMAANYTIEDIQRSFLRFTDEIEALQRGLSQLVSGFELELKRGNFTAEQRRGLEREIRTTQKLGDELVGRVESLERQLVSPLERAARERAFGAGSKGGAEELL